MTELGRRKHSRFLLAQPIEGSVRLCEEVDVEELNEREMIILSPQPCRVDERLAVEIPDDARARMQVRVSECGPAVAGDGSIRHRIRLAIERDGADVARAGEGEL
jgi:hypothetical protein